MTKTFYDFAEIKREAFYLLDTMKYPHLMNAEASRNNQSILSTSNKFTEE